MQAVLDEDRCDVRTLLEEGEDYALAHKQQDDAPPKVKPTTSRGRGSKPSLLETSVCKDNPYLAGGFLKDPLEIIASKAQDWLDDLNAAHQAARAPGRSGYNHNRFFPFQEMAACRNLESIGGLARYAHKRLCGLQALQQKPKRKTPACVVYSAGGNNNWSFERQMSKRTTCEIHTFDCTGEKKRFEVPLDIKNLRFHHVCLGDTHKDAPKKCLGDQEKCGETWTLTEIQHKLRHKRIDLLKTDMKSFEWPILESMPELQDRGWDKILFTMQVHVELHYRTKLDELGPGIDSHTDFKSAQDMVNLQSHLIHAGYTVVSKEDKGGCRHCTSTLR